LHNNKNNKNENNTQFSDSKQPEDNPLLRHRKSREDITFGSEDKNLAELRAEAMKQAEKMESESKSKNNEPNLDFTEEELRSVREYPAEEDNPLLRNEITKEDITFGSEDKNLAELRVEAMKQAEKMDSGTSSSDTEASSLVPPVTGGSNWVQLGPTAIPNGQTYGGARVLVTGRVTSLAMDYTDPETIWVGTAQGGVWKTTDGGINWLAMSDHEISLAIGAVALHPANHNIAYAGTGESNFSGDSYYGNGILKTTDGGNSWITLAQSTFSGARFSRIVLNPVSPDTIFSSTTVGLYRSTNGGTNWQLMRAGTATDVIIDPTNPNNVYAAFWADGIYKSTNANDSNPSWTKLTNGLPTGNFSRLALDISPSSPSTLFALMAATNYTIDKFYITEDGGLSWNQIPLPGGNIGGQGFYNIFLASDPNTPDIVYLCGIELWKATRDTVTGNWSISKIGGNIHPDCHAVSFDPTNSNIIYCGNDGGIYRSDDGGITWDDTINEGLCITQFEFMDQHPTSDAITFGGTQDNGTEQYRNSPVFYHAADGDGGYCTIDQTNPNIYFHTYYGPSPERSIEGGKFGSWTWIGTGLSDPSLFYPPLAVDQSNDNNIAFGTNRRVYLDNAQGMAGWGTSIILPNIGAAHVSAINYVNSNLLYIGTNQGKVYRIEFNGGSWNAIEISSSPLPSRYIWDVITLPSDVNTVIVVMSGFGTGHVWRGTFSGGTTTAAWTDISNNLPNIPCNALAIDPISESIFYVGTDIGIFRTTNSGSNWERFSEGLPNSAIYDLRLHASSRLLRVATHGRGMWEKKLDVLHMPDQDIFVRDNLMDSGRFTPSSENIDAGFEDQLQHVTLGQKLYRWMCADIKVDALEGSPPSYQFPVEEVDYVAFEAKLEHRNPQRGRTNRVYVQIHNRGIQPANNVTVKILYADASAGLPPLPADFWTVFPGDSIDVSNWKPIGSYKIITDLSPTEPQVLEWDWVTPLLAADHSCILCIVDCSDDPIPAGNKIFNVDQLGRIEKHTGFKNLHVVNAIPGTYYWTHFKFFGIEQNLAHILFTPSTAKGWDIGILFSKRHNEDIISDGMTLMEPTRSMLITLTKKIKEEINNYNTSRIFIVKDINKGGIIKNNKISTTGQDVMLLLIPKVSGSSDGIVTIIQQDQDNQITGGSTFVLRKKSI
jgi:photosystem II stability/assembly factor-like uncharacterized protein